MAIQSGSRNDNDSSAALPPMRVKRLWNGDLQLQYENGAIHRIGPHHPDYRLCLRSIRIDPKRARLGAFAGILLGLGILWYNWRLLATEGCFYPYLIALGLMALLFGGLVLVRPEYAGPARDEADRRVRMAVMMPLTVLALLATGIIWYLIGN